MWALILIILEAILWGALMILLLLGYLAYYSYKALKHVLRYIYSKIRARRLNSPSRLLYNKRTNELEVH